VILSAPSVANRKESVGIVTTISATSVAPSPRGAMGSTSRAASSASTVDKCGAGLPLTLLQSGGER